MESLKVVLYSVVTNAAILALATFFIRNWIERSIEHRYDKKLEELRTANEKELKQFSNALDIQRNLVSSAFLEARRASNDRRLTAIQTLWDGMIQIYFDAPSMVSLTDMTTTDTYQQICKGFVSQSGSLSLDEMLRKYAVQLKSESSLSAEKARLLTGEYLYALFFAYRAFIGSIALKLAEDSDEGRFVPWWEYDHVLTLLRPMLDDEEWNEFKQIKIGRYMWVIRNLEGKFVRWAEEIMDGRKAATDALDQAREIMKASDRAVKLGTAAA
jgi:hypothetical protein